MLGVISYRRGFFCVIRKNCRWRNCSDSSSFALIYKQSACQVEAKKEKREKFFEKGEKRRKNKKPGLTAYLKTSSQTGLFLGGAGKNPGEAGGTADSKLKQCFRDKTTEKDGMCGWCKSETSARKLPL